MGPTQEKKQSSVGCAGNRAPRLYNITAQEYIKQRSVVIENLCNGVVIKNAGTTIVKFNGVPIQPGESFSVGGNEGEVYIGRCDISFLVQTPPPATIINSAWVIQKFYVGENYI
jgi:hypothetical protein